METLESVLREFINQNFLFGRGDGLADDDSFMERGIIDSTGILELVHFVEETYSIRIEEDELVPENLDSVQRLTRFIRQKQEMFTHAS